MFVVYLIASVVLTGIIIGATAKNNKDIQKTKEYLEELQKVSIKYEQLEKRNIKAIHKLWVINNKYIS